MLHLKALRRCSLYNHFHCSVHAVADCNAPMKESVRCKPNAGLPSCSLSCIQRDSQTRNVGWESYFSTAYSDFSHKNNSEWGPLSLALILFLTVCSRALGGDADTHSAELHFRSVQSGPNDRRWELCGGPWVCRALDWQGVRSEDHQQRQMQRKGEMEALWYCQ